jgi:hypothetical protein
MNYSEIVKAINNKVGSGNYVIWIIGVTDTPETRKSHHKSDGKNIKYWSQWETDSEKVGRDIEKHFVDLGMEGDAEGGSQAEYVYVF